MDLPSSAYQSVEHDFGSWSEDLFPPLQTIPTADQQSVGDTLSFARGIDFSAYHDFPGISNFADLEPTWEGDTVPSVRDVKEDKAAQQEMCQYVFWSTPGELKSGGARAHTSKGSVKRIEA